MERFFMIADLGSNSVRMDVIGVDDNQQFCVVKRIKKTCRLSEGLQESNLLQKQAIDRTITILVELREIASVFSLEFEYAVATECLRRAKNRDEFLHRAKMESGFSFLVIDGQKEAYYDYLGVIHSIPLDDFLLLDTGGGSSELALVKDRKLLDSCSLPFGSVTLTEQFARGSSITREEYHQACCEVQKQLREISWLNQALGLPVVGLGGSIRTMGKISLRKRKITLPLHHYQMKAEEVFVIREEFLGMNHIERISVAGMDPLRADIITAGVLPLNLLMDMIQSPNLVISTSGLREGLCVEHYQKIWTK